MTDTQPSPEQSVSLALNNPNIPKIYANSFAGGVSPADMFVVVMSTGTPLAVLQMSYSVAKTLARELTRMVADVEAKIGQPILSLDELNSKLFPSQEK